ncbi:MAG: Si-specific NAD(P)(+) transhydrogenase [Phycisphaeraceae bacterium]|nr:Si-specific NAD(P)(+) transhydrogenase [Phycisphaerae bacterium]MBX3393362.1 Si-specific NAD(P)(+) transhydrogenase [Phycisphaeraceae bacterium]HRJ49462.1 Si-specific NAD(P)(+) transhydrogenase [Phycisphaerales bacterium]
MRHFDLCVIGSGAGGQRAAIQAAKLGRQVCVIERNEVVGGAAVNTGTIPSKALREAILHAAGCRAAVPGAADFLAARSLDIARLMASCQTVIKAEIDLVRSHFASNGIHLVTGRGQFRDPGTVDVIGEHASETVQADHTIIAVGTTPARPESVPFDGVNIITSDEIPRLNVLPRSIIVVGGGVIGSEYASMLSTIGVKTTLIEGRPRLLEFIDAEIAEAFQYHARQGGMTLRLGEKVVRIDLVDAPTGARSTDGIMVDAVLESGKILRADALLYCVGRQGATDGLCLENAGLAADSRGRISVNDRFQTAVPNIYAVGDVIGFPALASTSMEQGRLAACHIFNERCERMDELLPYGIYAIPEISMVGWTEERLTAEGIPYESGVAQYREIARGQLLGDSIGMLKLLIHQDSHTVLGVHAIGTGATELIHIGQAAIAFKATAEYFVNTVFNYPTLAECYKVAALNGLNKLRGV